MWSFAHDPKPNEPIHNKHGHQIWYCARCSYKTPNLKHVHEHLASKHNIRTREELKPKEVVKQATIEDIFGKQMECQEGRNIEQERHLLDAINKPAFNEALARLITVQNLPHSLIEAEEFHALIYAVNYMADSIVIHSHAAIPKLIQNSFLLHRGFLEQKLQQAISRIHFSIDMWMAPSQTAFQAIITYFIEANLKRLAKVLLSLREFKG